MPSKCRQHGINRAPVGPPVAAASIYLDHQATTPCDPEVVAAMAPWWSEGLPIPQAGFIALVLGRSAAGA